MPKGRCKSARICRGTVLVVLLFSLGFSSAFAEDCNDEGVKRGIKLYEDSKFDRSILELKNAIKRFQKSPKDESSLACLFKASIFIGMAYAGKGSEKEARDYFLSAAKAMPDKALNTPEYADYATPKLLSLYEEARRQVSTSAPSVALVRPQVLSSLSIKSNVTDGEVFLDDVRMGRAPSKIIDVSPGVHTVKVLHGTQKRERTYVIEPGKEVEITMDFGGSGHIMVSSQPGSAAIYLDGVMLEAKTPYLIKDTSAGEHSLRVSMDGFAESTQKVAVKADDVTVVTVRLELMTYTVKISSVPSGAQVRWDEIAKGTTPLVIDGVTAGKHKVLLTKENYEEQTDTVDVRNSSLERSYPLREQTGTVVITTDPPSVEVFVDGKYEGLTPFRRRYPLKHYALRLRKDGFVEKNLTFDIMHDKETAVNQSLTTIDTQLLEDKRKKIEAEELELKRKEQSQAESEAALRKEKENIEEAKKSAEILGMAEQMKTTKERFIIGADGTVIDRVTKLMWLRNGNYPMRGMTWEAAMKYCESMNYAGHNDWKLPTKEEWKTIVGKNGLDKTFPGHPFTNYVVHAGYWSSSVNPVSLTYAYMVNVVNGGVESFNKSRIAYVWPARYASEADLAEKK